MKKTILTFNNNVVEQNFDIYYKLRDFKIFK